MRMPSTLVGRSADVEYVRECVSSGACCSIVGISNLGKSALLRTITETADHSRTGPSFVYVDCNQMPERTARALFVTAWHAIAEVFHTRAANEKGTLKAHQIYDEIVSAASPMNAALLFGEGIEYALAQLPNPLVLCFDEFDEAYRNLEPQAFLNLRAFRDRFGESLVYLSATERELAAMTQTREQGEFYELLAQRVYYMHFMEEADTRAFCEQFAEREHVTFSAADLAFVWQNSDGHPGLAQAVCCALGSVTGEPRRDVHQDRVIHQHVQENLAKDEQVRSECDKIWDDLGAEERTALLHLNRPGADPVPVQMLLHKFILRGSEEDPHIFARLFDDYIRRLKFVQQPNNRGVFVDVDAGSVWVEGKPVEGLTDLEYRLILFLYGRLDRVCDKYSIVESVWGQDYVDTVDDARIEKLVSRVRQKIEPDPAHPRYITSLRGRGYKLVA